MARGWAGAHTRTQRGLIVRGVLTTTAEWSGQKSHGPNYKGKFQSLQERFLFIQDDLSVGLENHTRFKGDIAAELLFA